jgi:hypothetical protein
MQLRSSFYRAYARRLASWGYVCVQYDDPLLTIIDDATEVRKRLTPHIPFTAVVIQPHNWLIVSYDC